MGLRQAGENTAFKGGEERHEVSKNGFKREG
jgi:hypothetical protein